MKKILFTTLLLCITGCSADKIEWPKETVIVTSYRGEVLLYENTFQEFTIEKKENLIIITDLHNWKTYKIEGKDLTIIRKPY